MHPARPLPLPRPHSTFASEFSGDGASEIPTQTGFGGRRRVIGSLGCLALVGAMCLAGCGSDDAAGAPAISVVDSVAAATYEYTIPAGAGAAIDAGEPLDILPAELDAHVGDTIRIVNDDVRGHNVGPFFVGAGETMTQQFASPGDFVGICTVHPSGQFVLHVEA